MTRLRPLAPIAILALLTLLAACASHEAPPPDTASLTKQLAAHPWTVLEIHGRTVLDDTKVTMSFNADGTIKGFGGCNEFGGTYTVDGDSMTVAPVQGGDKVCSAGTTEQEYTFLILLAQINHFRFDDGNLLLLDMSKDSPMILTPEGGDSGGWFW